MNNTDIDVLSGGIFKIRLLVLKKLYEKYERYISSGAFLFGFVFDNLTLTRIDLLYDNLVLFSYLMIATISIAIFNMHEEDKLRYSFLDRYAHWLPLVMQFAFGGLFSGYVVFYTRSASIITSWPFLLILVFVLFGNEFFKKRYQQLTFQMSILFIAIFSFSIFFLPIIFHTLGALVFLASGVVSLVLADLLMRFLSRIIPVRMTESRRSLRMSIAGIYLLFNILYFTNIMPPIPLSLKEIGLYHSIERTRMGSYVMQFEPSPWYRIDTHINTVFHWIENQPVHVFSAVFAPSKLTTTILHKWEYFDEQKKVWRQSSRLQFPIHGGRDGGYRGYTLKRAVFPGRWRVSVITKRGQILGRIRFTVVEATEKPALETEIQ